MEFDRLGRRIIETNFQGGDLTSDAGLLLLRRFDKKIGLSQSAGRALSDSRLPERVKHRKEDLFTQRLYGLCCGYEDLNDHQQLRDDPLFQTCLAKESALGSSSTLCRMDASATRQDIINLHEVLFEQFIAAHPVPPKELILDFDASDIPLHGDQEGKQFHGYYDHYCFLPLYVYCGQYLLACILRNSRVDGAKHAGAVLKLLVKKLRKVWPDVKIIYRGDSGFNRQPIINWCERNEISYIVGVAKNPNLIKLCQDQQNKLAEKFIETRAKQRHVFNFRYAAKSWKRERRIIARLEYSDKGTNPRFVVTNLKDSPGDLYDGLYCQRGEAENRIKEVQLDLFGTRSSCSRFISNAFRLMISALAYTLMVRFRQAMLVGTQLARASANTIRLRLFKIGAAITKNTRRIRVFLASNHPSQHLFYTLACAMANW